MPSALRLLLELNWCLGLETSRTDVDKPLSFITLPSLRYFVAVTESILIKLSYLTSSRPAGR